MKVLFLLATTLSMAVVLRAQTATDYYVTTELDTVYGEFSSNRGGKIRFKVDGKNNALDPLKTYRVYDAEESKLYAPSYIENCIVKIEGSDPKMYKVSERLRRIEKPLFAEVLTDGEIVVYGVLNSKYINDVLGPKRTKIVGPNGNATVIHSDNITIPIKHHSLRIYALKKSTNEMIELEKTSPVLFFKVSVAKIDNNLSKFFAGYPELIDEIAKQPKISYEYMMDCIKRYNEQKELIGEGISSFGVQVF